MTAATEFLSTLVRSALGRGGREEEPSPAPIPAPEAAPAASEVGTAETDGSAGPDPGLVCILSEKVLLAWLRNRYQLLFPFVLDLRRLDRAQVDLFIRAMVAAAQADGGFDGRERERIEGMLSLVNPDAADRGVLDAALEGQRPLNEVLREVRDVQTAALFYAASLMAVDRRNPVNHHYLRYLAARLQLSDELVTSLEQRFRPSA
ncbi:tellurite resistance TerB family protein (plasmid) [Skermanella rosea]|uniref:DUF533 domain-containing protein n=1 Tax=Skermanella rosea TaxID=1817965 RepID=UPI0019330CC7|nr:DUF533 domain-containing protein [Skermanella rosea]UEM07913.1 tellurite resistance TerB family protein [Skermanella rosea]